MKVVTASMTPPNMMPTSGTTSAERHGLKDAQEQGGAGEREDRGVLPGHDRDAGRRVGDGLLEARRGDHDRVELQRVPGHLGLLLLDGRLGLLQGDSGSAGRES